MTRRPDSMNLQPKADAATVGRCDGCGRPIAWTELSTGRLIAVDALPVTYVPVRSIAGRLIEVTDTRKHRTGPKPLLVARCEPVTDDPPLFGHPDQRPRLVEHDCGKTAA